MTSAGRTLAFSLVLTVAACGGKVVVDGMADESGGVGGGTSSSSSTTVTVGQGGASTTSTSSSSAGGQGGDIFDAGGPDVIDPPPPPPPVAVYAHSGDTLWYMNPNSKQVSVVGAFKGCGNVTDIAVDMTGAIWGTTPGGLYTIDAKTAACTPVAGGSYPNSLSFVPKGTVDPDKEALVGYLESAYVRIDEKTGETKPIGTLGGGYVSSGDLVSVIGAASYLTVKGNGCNDCFVQIDPATGELVKMIGPLKYEKVWGLAYWDGVAYGFTQAGALMQIDLATAATTPIAIPNAPPGLTFWGAGSSTAAPQ